MKIKMLALAAVAASVLAAGPASASISIGDILQVQYNFPDLGTIYSDSGTFTYTGAGQSVLSSGITTVVLGDNAVVFANDQGFYGSSFALGSFNGPVLTDLSNSNAFSGWHVASATAPYTSALLTGSAIGVNFAGQSYTGGDVTISGIPEVSTWAMMLAGFAGLGFLGYRRGKVASVAA